MHSKINELLEEIDKKKWDLQWEYKKLMEKYDFQFSKKGDPTFSQKAKLEYKKLKNPLFKYIFTSRIRNLLSAPFIYMMLVPAVILDVFLTLYQHVCFRLYGIPRVRRKDYIVYDRRLLSYLNIVEKINCIYCSYVNWLFWYAVEIGGRTEKYWCPIKNASRTNSWHNWQKNFADYGDAKWFKEEYNNAKCFNNLK